MSPIGPADAVRRLFDAMQARDWSTAAALVDDHAAVVWPVTGERFVGHGYVEMNRSSGRLDRHRPRRDQRG